jgi:hypothetical protein
VSDRDPQFVLSGEGNSKTSIRGVGGGGHSGAGLATCDDGMVIDFTQMKGVRFDRRFVIVAGIPYFMIPNASVGA